MRLLTILTTSFATSPALAHADALPHVHPAAAIIAGILVIALAFFICRKWVAK